MVKRCKLLNQIKMKKKNFHRTITVNTSVEEAMKKISQINLFYQHPSLCKFIPENPSSRNCQCVTPGASIIFACSNFVFQDYRINELLRQDARHQMNHHFTKKSCIEVDCSCVTPPCSRYNLGCRFINLRLLCLSNTSCQAEGILNNKHQFVEA
jgi:hypothetical protein